MTDYNKLKVTELKELLKERGIPSTGLSRKNQIVEALEAHDASNDTGKQGDVEQDGAEVEHGGDIAEAGENGAVGEEAQEGQATEADALQADPTLPVDNDTKPGDAEPESAATVLEPSVTEMEKNEPVSKEPSTLNTPQKASPGGESVSSETRKRKRRSPTPTLSQESVNKKLKAAEEELVKLPEDAVVEDAPAPLDEAQNSLAAEGEAKTVQPLSVSDDVMEVTDTLPAESTRPRSGSPMDTGAPEADVRGTEHGTMDDGSGDASAPPSMHPSTRAIYIRGLVRPLQPHQLRDHLAEIAKTPADSTVIQTFHLDTLRTHAFVVFETLQAASTARSALHGRVWPDEPARKELWVDYIPEARVQDWIEEEVATGSRRDAKKWEVVYDTDEDGQVTASHQEVSALPPPPARQSSFSNAGQGMPNAPLGPRADRPSTSTQRPAPIERTPSNTQSTPKPSERAPSNATFDVLDQNFHFTTAKPKLYWLPVSAHLATQRLDELAAQTSRSWDGGRAMRDANNVEKQLRRYTFEDGDRVVDNGADIPSFRSEGGRPPGSGPPPPGRGGRGGGGGGYRGRR